MDGKQKKITSHTIEREIDGAQSADEREDQKENNEHVALVIRRAVLRPTVGAGVSGTA